jgi:hypothetical protein
VNTQWNSKIFDLISLVLYCNVFIPVSIVITASLISFVLCLQVVLPISESSAPPPTHTHTH